MTRPRPLAFRPTDDIDDWTHAQYSVFTRYLKRIYPNIDIQRLKSVSQKALAIPPSWTLAIPPSWTLVDPLRHPCVVRLCLLPCCFKIPIYLYFVETCLPINLWNRLCPSNGLNKGSHPGKKAAHFWTLSKSGLDPPHPFWTHLG